MYRNLVGEMAKNKVTNKQVSLEIKVTTRAVRNKIYGVSDFTWKEAIKIKEKFFPELELTYLFAEG